MRNTTSRTAILLFARSSEEEAHKKWLPDGERIYTSLNKRAKKLASESGLAFFHSSEKDQVGIHFGKRFCHALKQIFDQGYTSVISIGNDTPQLTQHDIQDALARLQNHNAVIGPSKDGGIYLLGIRATDFDVDGFSGLKWCSSLLRGELVHYFETRGKDVSLLGWYQDLDTVTDLQLLSNITKFIPIGIIKALRAAVKQFHLGFFRVEIQITDLYWRPHLTRGSPR